MKYNTMKATVSGFTCDNEAFTVTCDFTMIPPKKGEPHYGTGYYMMVEMPGDHHYVDVRYEHTTDIEVLADAWIQNYFGKNAKEVIKEFPVPAGKMPIEVIVEDGQVAVRCCGGEWLMGDIDNRWLWVLGAIAFPEEHTIQINDKRKKRQDHQKDMTTR